MGIAYKNMWSLNTDEAVVTGILRNELPANYEVLMPMNAQMKGIDLVVVNILNKRLCTIQVKGSRAFEPSRKALLQYGAGSGGWWFLDEKTINQATADYFIFLLYVLEDMSDLGRRILTPHSITIPTAKLQELTKLHKKLYRNSYSYYFWINPKTKEAFDTRDNLYYVNECLDKQGYNQMLSVIA